MQDTITSKLSLIALSQLLHGEENIEVIKEALMSEAMQMMESDFASLQFYDSDKGALLLLGHKNFKPESEHFWRIVFTGSGSTCGEALGNKARVKVNDVDKASFMAGTGDLRSYRFSGIRSVQSTPLISSGNEFIGMISTHWRAPRDLDSDNFELFDLLALLAADLLGQKKGSILERLYAS